MRRSPEVYGFITDVTELADDGWYGNPGWADVERAEDFTDVVAGGVLAGIEVVMNARRHPRKPTSQRRRHEQTRSVSRPSVWVAGRGCSRAAPSAATQVELYSCFSRDPAKRAAFQEEFGIERSASSYEELLADPAVEGVLITTPNDTHMEVITQALQAGKAVYTDKPIAHTLEDANRIAAVVAETGSVFAVGHSSRRLSGHREMKRWIDDGRLGEVSLAEANFSNERGLELTPADLALVRRQEPGRRVHPARRAPRRHPAVPARPGEERLRARAQAVHEGRGARTPSWRSSSSRAVRWATSAPAGPPPASTR